MAVTKGFGTTGDGAGVVTPLDQKLAQAGLLAKAGAGSNLIRPGLFYDGASNIVLGKANMSYDVAPFTAATTRGAAAGAVLLANDGVVNVATSAAPGSNSRYDVVYVWPREFSLDGVDSTPVIGVEQGTAASSPTVPSLAAFPGAIELARILVPAGVTATNSGTTITQTSPFTTVDGGTLVRRTTAERDAITAPFEGLRCRVLANATDYEYASGAWTSFDTGWIQPALGTGWTNVSGSEVKYRRKNGIVYLQGRASVTTGGGATANAFTLPAGFRPSSQIILFAEAANSTTRFSVFTTGVVGQLSLEAKSNVSFANIPPFPADA